MCNLKVKSYQKLSNYNSLIGVKSEGLAIVTPDGRFDASDETQKSMHYVYGLEIIDLEKLEEMFYEPGLHQRLLGSDKDPLRSIMQLKDIRLYPEIVEQSLIRTLANSL